MSGQDYKLNIFILSTISLLEGTGFSTSLIRDSSTKISNFNCLPYRVCIRELKKSLKLKSRINDMRYCRVILITKKKKND